MPAPPLPHSVVVNLGGLLEAVTQGLYRSTFNHVRNPTRGAMRVRFPFFFDPGFAAPVAPLTLPAALAAAAATERAARVARGGDAHRDGRSLAVQQGGCTSYTATTC